MVAAWSIVFCSTLASWMVGWWLGPGSQPLTGVHEGYHRHQAAQKTIFILDFPAWHIWQKHCVLSLCWENTRCCLLVQESKQNGASKSSSFKLIFHSFITKLSAAKKWTTLWKETFLNNHYSNRYLNSYGNSPGPIFIWWIDRKLSLFDNILYWVVFSMYVLSSVKQWSRPGPCHAVNLVLNQFWNAQHH